MSVHVTHVCANIGCLPSLTFLEIGSVIVLGAHPIWLGKLVGQ